MSSYKEVLENKRQEMLDKLIEAIESNPQKWEKGWWGISTPVNGISKRQYTRLNALYLYLIGEMKKYGTNYWVTFDQAKKVGGSIKKGEKGTSVFFFKSYDISTKKEWDDSVLEGLSEEAEREYVIKNKRYILRESIVFNVDQCINMPDSLKNPSMPEQEIENTNKKIEKIIGNSEAPILHDEKDSAYYDTKEDKIHLPQIKQFKNMNSYYATALHEISHSTGHESRLNRQINNKFGSEEYAIEELRAELACCYIQMDMDINLNDAEIMNHGAYLAGWLNVVKKDPTVLLAADKDAREISSYIREKYFEKIKIATTTEAKSNNEYKVRINWTESTYLNPTSPVSLDNSLKASKEGDDYKITYPAVGSFKVSELPEEIKEAAVWLIENGHINNSDVQSAFYYRLTSAWSDDPDAEDKDNKRIKKVYEDLITQKKNIEMSFAEADFTLKMLDKYSSGYDKIQTEFSIIKNGENIFTDRIDLGDGYINQEFKNDYGIISMFETRSKKLEEGSKKSEYLELIEELKKHQDLSNEKKTEIEMAVYRHYKGEYEKIQNEYRKNHSTNDEMRDDRMCSIYVCLKRNESNYEILCERIKKESDSNFKSKIEEREKRISNNREFFKKKKLENIERIEKNVPEELKKLNQWCAYQVFKNPETGETKKYIWDTNFIPPVGYFKQHKWASCTNPESWASFEHACKYAKENNCDGLTLVLRKENGITCIDLDSHIVDGERSNDLNTLLEILPNTYSEISYSGEGAHIFLKGNQILDGKIARKNDENGWECYDNAKFISITGDVFPEIAPKGLVEPNILLVKFAQEKLNSSAQFRKRLEQERIRAEKEKKAAKKTTTKYASTSDVISMIRSSSKGREFDALMNGEDICGDKSRSDLKLMNILAFFTNGDRVQMESIFRDSRLYRPEKGEAYLKRTINFAVDTLVNLPNENLYGSSKKDSSKTQNKQKGR